MHTLLSRRINSFPSSATFVMSKKGKELQQQGHNIIDLSIGEPHFTTPLYIQQGAKEAIDQGDYFSYSPVPGYYDLRVAIAKKLNTENKIDCTPEQIVVSTGAKQAIANVLLSLLNPGDAVIIFTPYWVSYKAMVLMAEGVPIFLKGPFKNNFAPTTAQLEETITPNTKAVIFSSPCNPTGLVFSKEQLSDIATVIAKYPDIMVIADEIYEYINFTKTYNSIGALSILKDRVVTINGLSKGHAMTGWRIGYMAAPMWLATACEKLQGQITTGACSIAQRAALTAIQGDNKVVHEMAADYLAKRNIALSLLATLPEIHYCIPDGGLFIFIDVRYYLGKSVENVIMKNVDTLCMYLLTHAYVVLVPGSAFGEPSFVRLSFGVQEEQLVTGIASIKKTLARFY